MVKGHGQHLGAHVAFRYVRKSGEFFGEAVLVHLNGTFGERGLNRTQLKQTCLLEKEKLLFRQHSTQETSVASL